VIRQGELYWLRFGPPESSEPAGRRPAVAVQHDRFNRSAVPTAIVAAITSSLRLAAMPGNVRLRKGEAGLPRPSVVNASQIRTVDRARLGERIGALGAERMRRVLVGLALWLGTESPAGDGG
jgi:mRNA interferase MazF